ncbi:MAG: sigma-70 family RNA polymerase sigma factor, partial [candidate division KSB1 bacterium]|nr:sigma-70 family RNA polymerase sigma factor [candidate division KSB1 bacterium]
DAEAVVADARERPDVELERNETRALVWQALERLPPPQRAVLVLQKYEELSCEEIATVMNCSVGAVQARLHRAKENLAKILIPLLREK